jgi:Phage major capsid protein E
MMTPSQISLNQSPILTNLLLGMGQGKFIAESLFPRLPQALNSITLAQLGDERFKRYNLRRAPGTSTKRVEVNYKGKTYTVDQYAVEVPMPREVIRESDESRRLNIGNHLDISRIAMNTASDILALDYELDVATLATTATTYAAGHSLALSAGTKWRASTGTPVSDIRAAIDVIRKKIGMRPNTLALSNDAFTALIANTEVRGYLPNSQLGPATVDQLKTILDVSNIVRGDAIFTDAAGVGQDIWGNNAILAYVPTIGGAGGGSISLAEPAFGFTNVLDGHPFAETPYFENSTKSWIYGATYERRPNVAYNTAGFLFQNVA